MSWAALSGHLTGACIRFYCFYNFCNIFKVFIKSKQEAEFLSSLGVEDASLNNGRFWLQFKKGIALQSATASMMEAGVGEVFFQEMTLDNKRADCCFDFCFPDCLTFYFILLNFILIQSMLEWNLFLASLKKCIQHMSFLSRKYIIKTTLTWTAFFFSQFSYKAVSGTAKRHSAR